MKICHLVPHFGQGGDIVVVKSIIRLLVARGYSLTINTINLDQYSPQTDNPFPLNQGVVGILKSIRNFNKLEKHVDVLHAHSPICLVFALLVRQLYIPTASIVFTFHWPVADAGLRRYLKAQLMKLPDIIHVISTEIEDDLKSRYSISRNKLMFIPLGIPPEKFLQQSANSDKSHIREQLHLPKSAKVIGYLGRLATEKNVDFLIKFLDQYSIDFPDLHLAIAGSGDLEDVLRQQAATSSAADKIHFLGYTDQPEVVYRAFDLLILPSSFEAFPLVVVESAYCGVPTLRSDAQGSSDQIEDDVTGFLFSNDVGYSAMADKLNYVLKNKWQNLEKIGQLAKQHMLELCDPECFATRLIKCYEDAISSKLT